MSDTHTEMQDTNSEWARLGVESGDYCPIALEADLLQPIAGGGRYLKVAEQFRSYAGFSLRVYCMLDSRNYTLSGDSKDSLEKKDLFAAFAKEAVLQMGYRGKDPLQFFLHHLRLWHCANYQNVGGRDFRNAYTFQRPSGGVTEHSACVRIENIFHVAANYSVELEFQARRTDAIAINEVSAVNSAVLQTSERSLITQGLNRATPRRSLAADIEEYQRIEKFERDFGRLYENAPNFEERDLIYRTILEKFAETAAKSSWWKKTLQLHHALARVAELESQGAHISKATQNSHRKKIDVLTESELQQRATKGLAISRVEAATCLRFSKKTIANYISARKLISTESGGVVIEHRLFMPLYRARNKPTMG